MVTPIIIAVTCEVPQAIPAAMREASLAISATRWQTVKAAVLPAALPGVAAAVVLGFSRAFGETMAVLTHILRQARRLADHVHFMYMGELVEAGPAAKVVENPQAELTRACIGGEL